MIRSVDLQRCHLVIVHLHHLPVASGSVGSLLICKMDPSPAACDSDPAFNQVTSQCCFGRFNLESKPQTRVHNVYWTTAINKGLMEFQKSLTMLSGAGPT